MRRLFILFGFCCGIIAGTVLVCVSYVFLLFFCVSGRLAVSVCVQFDTLAQLAYLVYTAVFRVFASSRTSIYICSFDNSSMLIYGAYARTSHGVRCHLSFLCKIVLTTP